MNEEKRYPKKPDTALVDEDTLKIEDLERSQFNKIDKRFEIEHTFTTTGVEQIEHKFGRIPRGFFVISQTKAATISGDPETWTAKRIKLASSVSNNKVRLIIV